MKIKSSSILCILDGMSGEGFERGLISFSQLGSKHVKGFMNCTPPGFRTESMNCILHLLGVGGEQIPAYGRAWLEALGAGIEVSHDDLVLRASWVKTQNGKIDGFYYFPPTPSGHEKIRYYSLGGYKSILVLPGFAKLINKVKTFAPHEHFGKVLQDALPLFPDSLRAYCLNYASNNIALIPWAESVKTDLPVVDLPACLISGTGLVKGIGKSLGADVFSCPEFTGETDTHLRKKVETALEMAKHYPLVVLHINGADEAAHRRNSIEKKLFLEKADEQVISLLDKSPHKLLICSDHATCAETGSHRGGENMFVLRNFHTRGDVGSISCSEAMKLLFN